MNYDQGHCSPKSLRGNNNNNSCLNRKLLVKLAKILNNNPKCDHIDCKSNNNNLHDNICENMTKISDCKSEYCWLTVQDIVQKLKGPEIDEFKEHFRPKMPDDWVSDKNKWLNTNDIDKVLLQYEKAYPEFEYLGAHPIDAHKCSVSDEVCNININDLLKNKKKQVGIVFNTDDSSGEGEHWVSFYVDLMGKNRQGNPGAYYFDSVADKPQKEIFDLVKKLKKQAKKKKMKLDFFYNDIQHQKKDTECGIYSMFFLTHMLSGVDFKKFVKEIKRDEFMEKYRKIFYVDLN